MSSAFHIDETIRLAIIIHIINEQ